MQSISKTWLALLVIVAAGAAARIALPARRFLPTTTVLTLFPSRLGTYVAQEEEFSNSEATRRAYAPAAIVYRSYSNGQDPPVDVFIAPEPVGAHSPSICARYTGSVVEQMSVASLPGIPGLRFHQTVSRPPAYAEDRLSVCAYYWRTPDGPVDEQQSFARLGKLAMALRAGEPSFRVQMCTRAGNATEAAGALEQLADLVGLVDPEVQRLLQKAVLTGN